MPENSPSPRLPRQRDTTAVAAGKPPGVVVAGDLDVMTAPRLRLAATAACEDIQGRRSGEVIDFVLDLTDVTFIDSSGLHVLEDIRAQVSEYGWTFRIDPPVASGPRRLLLLAVRKGWLAHHDLAQDRTNRSGTILSDV